MGVKRKRQTAPAEGERAAIGGYHRNTDFRRT